MKKKALVKYLLCVVLLTGIAFVCGAFFQRQINESVAIFCCGWQLMLYLSFARLFQAGEHFDIILFFVV